MSIILNCIEKENIEKNDVTEIFISRLRDLGIRVENSTPVFAISTIDEKKCFEIKSSLVYDIEYTINKIKEADPYVVMVVSAEEIKYLSTGKKEYKIRMEILAPK
ncbi:hypothetical protein ASswx1_396 [Aeromonas phage Asswx_1]|uniref:Uncharacterized protein n=1 Tax=Aeromonas phage Asswx_1 TaxID=2419739 RepID=A0A411B8T5_9CAUD|nr:hypothetical protein ASswx1_396 [Aeromonas phage Asswx_1]